jgi:type IV pilus assembly protein PilC
MKIFVWEGVTPQGAKTKGEVEASDANVVRQLLIRQRINPVSIKEKGKSLQERLPFLTPSVTEKDRVLFTRQFATLINSGIPIVQALEVQANQQENPYFGKLLKEIKQDVESGSTLAEAMKKHPKLFDRLYVNMIAAGELGGILDGVMNRLAAYMEKAQRLKRKVKGALTYPIIVLAISVIVLTIIMVFVIPVFAKMFSESGTALPGPTQFVINISNFLKTYFVAIVIGFVILSFVFKKINATPQGKLIVDRIMLRLPVFGSLLRKVAVAKFARTMGTLITSGVSIIDTINIAAGTAGNKVVENVMYEVKKSVSEGRSISQPLHESSVFPPMVVSMVAVGESTGALDTMLNKVADFYDEEVDAAVDALTAAIEPMMVVFLGGTVGTIIIAMYLPIFEMASTVK